MSAQQGSLLVVDDNEMNRDMLSRRLTRSGYNVTVAANGEQALEKAERQTFDVVLLDIMMPGIDGLEVLKRLREKHSATDLSVIMATAKDETDDVIDALRLGANDYVTKPLNFPVVLARVETQMSLKRSVDEIRRLQHSLEQRNEELAALNAQLATANNRMKRDLEAAAQFQQAMLPSGLTNLPGVRFAWIFDPCDELGGDALNIIPLDDRNVGLYVVDVAGHGVASALLSVTLSHLMAGTANHTSILRQHVEGTDQHKPRPPADIARKLCTEFPFDSRTEKFFTMLYGQFDLHTGEFRYVSAGHPAPIHIQRNASPTLLETEGGFPIGLTETNYDEHSVLLGRGDRLYLYSDGVCETMNADDELFGAEGLLKVLDRSRNLPLSEGLTLLNDELKNWRGEVGARDDVTVLAVEIPD